MIKKQSLNISNCHIICPTCKQPTEFKMFESGPGGDFQTIYGTVSKRIYRIDLAMIYYMKLKYSDFIGQIAREENDIKNVMEIPEKVKCNYCNTYIYESEVLVDNEIKIDAYIVE